MKDFFRRVGENLFPSRCCICDRILPYQQRICPECRKLRIRYGGVGAQCDICGLPRAKCICSPARFYQKAVFPFFYTDNVRKSLQKLKFRARTDKAEPFAQEMAAALHERGVTDETDLLTFIPMSEARQKARGYNQAELLCGAVSAKTGIPYKALLETAFDTQTQHGLRSSARRRGNILGMYEPIRSSADEISGKRILIVDDILTSGATLNEAAKTLLIFGAESVSVCAAAATPKYKKQKNTRK